MLNMSNIYVWPANGDRYGIQLLDYTNPKKTTMLLVHRKDHSYAVYFSYFWSFKDIVK